MSPLQAALDEYLATRRALGRIGPAAKAAVPDLLDLLSDDREDIRTAATTALGRIDPAAQPKKDGP